MKAKIERKQKPVLKIKKESSTGESTLKKAVKNVNKVFKNKDIKAVTSTSTKSPTEAVTKTIKNENIIKIKGIKVKKPITKAKKEVKSTERGLVYIGHIPHGFYEEEMKGYFSQFGRVTRVRVARSQKTGQSKGFGFVEFELPEIAKIAAESMNNYLMGGRLVKAEYITPEKQHKKYFKGPAWSKSTNPTIKNRLTTIKKHNAPVPKIKQELAVKKSVKRLSKLSEKLKAQGINLKIQLGDVQI